MLKTVFFFEDLLFFDLPLLHQTKTTVMKTFSYVKKYSDTPSRNKVQETGLTLEQAQDCLNYEKKSGHHISSESDTHVTFDDWDGQEVTFSIEEE